MLYQGGFHDAEWSDRYQPGGYHPVHLGDLFKDGRYKIIHKLGNGSYATVWLARDQELQRFVAIKIMVSDPKQGNPELEVYKYLSTIVTDHPGRQHILQLLDTFDVAGPNGTHVCLVLEVTGPSVADTIQNSPEGRLQSRIAREISRQTLLGVGYLHENSIAHCDLHVGNLLLTSSDPDLRTEREILDDMGEPSTSELRRKDGEPLGPEAPRYIVEPARFPVDLKRSSLTVKIADFGGARFWNDMQGVPMCPMMFCPPEVMFGDSWDARVDIWSLGITVFELVVGTPPFSNIGIETAEDRIVDMIELVGKLPRQWNSKWISQLTDFMENLPERAKPAWAKHRKEAQDDELRLQSLASSAHALSPNETLQMELSGTYQLNGIEVKLNLCYFGHHPDWKEDLSTTDINVLASLLSQMLRYDPSTRVPPSTLLKHAWFGVEQPTKDEEPSTQGDEVSEVEAVRKVKSQLDKNGNSEEAQQGADGFSHKMNGIKNPQEAYDSKTERIDKNKRFDKVLDLSESVHHGPLQASNIESSSVDTSKAEEPEHGKVNLESEVSEYSSDDTQKQEASRGASQGLTIPSWARWMRIGFQRLSKMIR